MNVVRSKVKQTVAQRFRMMGSEYLENLQSKIKNEDIARV